MNLLAQDIPNADFNNAYLNLNGISLPSNFRARVTTLKYHGFAPLAGYNSSGAGFFNTKGEGVATGYFYSSYDDSGEIPDYHLVRPFEEYSVAVKYRMDASFYESKKSAIFLQALFFSGDSGSVAANKPIAQIDSKRSSEYDYKEPEKWYELQYTFVVPQNVAKIGLAVYFTGDGKILVDDLEISLIGSSKEIKDNTSEQLKINFVPLLNTVKIVSKKKQDFREALGKYELKNEAVYAAIGDSLWTFKNVNCHPQMRLTANLVSGIFNGYNVLKDSIFYMQKAHRALAWIVSNQQNDGSFYWYPTNSCSKPVIDSGSIMYEGSIAMIALKDGYLNTNNREQKAQYYLAAKRFCDYLLKLSPHANTNFNGFAIWALSEFSTIASTKELQEQYLNKAWELFNHIATQQTAQGNWPDFHNKHIYYHSIITRGITALYLNQVNNLVFSEVQKLKLRETTYKAVNYLLSQIKTADGELQKHPEIKNITIKSPFALDAILLALQLPELNLAESQHLKLVSAILANFNLMSTQGHEMAAMGRYLQYKYN